MHREWKVLALCAIVACLEWCCAASRPPLLAAPIELRVQQRSTFEVPGSSGRLRLAIDDVTENQVRVSLTVDGKRIVSSRSMTVGDTVPFEFDSAHYELVLSSFEKHLIHDDFANFIIRESAATASVGSTEASIRAPADIATHATHRLDGTSPERLRARRHADLTSIVRRRFELTRHVVSARVAPQSGMLDVTDEFEIHSLGDSLSDVYLLASDDAWMAATGDSVEPLARGNGQVRIAFPNALARDERATIRTVMSNSRSVWSERDVAIPETPVVAQVRPASSFAAQLHWYPVDVPNDATVDLTFHVPAPLTAVSGGRLVETSESDGWRRFRYVDDARVGRPLPFGFAVGEYVSRAITTEDGLTLTVFGFPGEESRIEQRLAPLAEAARFYTRRFGPLPWTDVRLAHVKPAQGATHVSMPALILLSDEFFGDLSGAALEDWATDPAAAGALAMVDELTHQWNGYAAGFPHELGEGLGAYSDKLLIEARSGADAYRRAIRTSRDLWLSGDRAARTDVEFAIANPRTVENRRFGATVLSKSAVVLHQLRRELGDEVFFDGLRRAFARTDRSVDGFDRLEQGFEEASGRELRPFFDQWFFRAGAPIVSASFERTRNGVAVTVRQTQAEDAYEFPVDVEVECEDGTKPRFEVALRGKETRFETALASPPRAVALDPDRLSPSRVE